MGLVATYTFTFQTNTDGSLSNGAGYVNIIFPQDFIFDQSSTISCTVMNTGSSSSISSSCSGTTATDPYGMGNYVSKVYGSLNCGTLICTGGSSFTFTVTGYYNDYNTEPRTGDIITVYTSSGTGSTSQILTILHLNLYVFSL